MGLGAFVLVAALLSRFYAYDRLAVVPLDQDTTSISEATGATVFDIASQQEITTDLVSTRDVTGDVSAAEEASDQQGRDIAIWENLLFTAPPGVTVDEENPPLSANHDRVVFDRHTGAAIDCCGHYLSSSADTDTGREIRDTETAITGQFFKLPFGSEKVTYQFWDNTIKDSTDMKYQATEKIDGLVVYRYQQVIEPTDVANITAPASFFGIDKQGNVTVDRIYSNTRTIWVEPETGVIIRGQEDQFVTADYQGEPVATLTDATVTYTDETVKDNVDEYGPLATSLKLVRDWIPLGGLILGLVLLIIGAALIARARSEAPPAEPGGARPRHLTEA